MISFLTLAVKLMQSCVSAILMLGLFHHPILHDSQLAVSIHATFTVRGVCKYLLTSLPPPPSHRGRAHSDEEGGHLEGGLPVRLHQEGGPVPQLQGGPQG